MRMRPAITATGTPRADDGCERCDPSRSPDGWSPNTDPDPRGLGCQLRRIVATTGAMTCRPAVLSALSRRIARARALIDRLAASPPAEARRLETRLERIAAGLTRAAARAERRGTCTGGSLVTEVTTLATQLHALRRVR